VTTRIKIWPSSARPTVREQRVQVLVTPGPCGVDQDHELGDGTVDRIRSTRAIGYADLAVAVLDAIEQPSAQRAQRAVYGARV